MAREADGLAGKPCIHTGRAAAVNAGFIPLADRVPWAERGRVAFAADLAAGMLATDGKTIDRPHLRLAERILAQR